MRFHPDHPLRLPRHARRAAWLALLAVAAALGGVAAVASPATAPTNGATASAGAGAARGDEAPDPLDSPLWSAVRAAYLEGGEVRFDERVRVWTPSHAENALEVPVEVRADLADVERMVLIADLNPIPRILEYRPGRARPTIAFRFKVEQSTPVRAAVRTTDGVWHVGGVWLSAAGGGCTTPSRGTGGGAWRDHLNEVSARLWAAPDGGEHLKFRVIHPMDTGLAGGIPPFHLDTLRIETESGGEIARLTTYEPVSENPVLDLQLPDVGAVRIVGTDTNGNPVRALVAAAAR